MTSERQEELHALCRDVWRSSYTNDESAVKALFQFFLNCPLEEWPEMPLLEDYWQPEPAGKYFPSRKAQELIDSYKANQ